MFGVHARPVLLGRPIRAAPVFEPVYSTTLTTTTDETTTTWTGVDIGPEHPKRIVILAMHQGVAASATGIVNGSNFFFRSQNGAHEFALLAFFAPVRTLADISVSATGSIRKEVSVYYAYPRSHMPVGYGNATANTATNATISPLYISGGGFLVYAGGQHATLGAFTVTKTNVTIDEDVDAQYESASSFTSGSGLASQLGVADLVLAETVSGTKRVTAGCWQANHGKYL